MLESIHLHFLEMARRRTLPTHEPKTWHLVDNVDESNGSWKGQKLIQCEKPLVFVQELLEWGLIEPGARDAYKLTSKGRQALKDAWRNEQTLGVHVMARNTRDV